MASNVLQKMQASSTDGPNAPRRVKSNMSLPKKRYDKAARYGGHLTTAHSSAEDVSTTSDSDRDNDYQTDFTTPASSASDCGLPEFREPDDVEDFRDEEYPQLKGKVYLDHGGATLYAKSLVDAFSADLVSNLYGNPHSASTPSKVAGHRVDEIRERTLRFFNADPAHFDLVFVANATAAVKLVIDCFKDHAAVSNTPVWYGYHRDAHTSLVGVREATKMHRCFTSDEEVDIWINSGGLGGPRARQLGLFAYPGQSNMTGRRLPLSWPGRIRRNLHKATTYTLLDAAALATTSPIDLSDPSTAPDFVCLSFYKIFGFPDLGALLVRKESAHVLENRRYFGGGTVEMVVSIQDTWHAKKETSLHDRLEDGTLPFHNIIALDHAMDVHERLYGPNPMKFISNHTQQLGKQMYDNLSSLRHANGSPLLRIYKDEATVFGDPSMQGATIAFNVLKSNGSLIGFEEVEQAADAENIYVRSGSLCNPGGVATYLDWSPAEMKAAFAAGHRCSHPTQIMLGKATGVVRVSLGAMSTASDVQKLVRFLRETYIDTSGAPRLGRTSSLPMLNTTFTSSNPMSSSSSKYHSQVSPISAISEGSVEIKAWEVSDEDRPPLPMSISSPNLDFEKAPAHSPFDPADFAKRRKPWEEEIRRQAAAAAIMDIKSREANAEDAGSDRKSGGGGGTPSTRARKFGRSVVNLLKAKSGHNSNHNFVDLRPPSQKAEQQPPQHSQPLPSVPAMHTGSDARSQTSTRRSVERQQFAQNLHALGLSS